MPLNETVTQITPNLFRKKTEFVEAIIEGPKARRTEEILTTTIELNGHTFEVDEASMDRFDRVIGLANYKFNQTIASGITAAQAYQAIYQQNTIIWKTHHNEFVEITIENICQLQELALTNLQQIWIKWG